MTFFLSCYIASDTDAFLLPFSGCIHHSEIYRVMCSMSPPVGFGKKCPKIVGYKVCKFIYTWLNWLNLTPIQRYAVFRHQLRKDAVSLNFSLTFSLSNAFLVFKRNVFSLHLVPCNLPWNGGGGGGREFLKKESFYARTFWVLALNQSKNSWGRVCKFKYWK